MLVSRIVTNVYDTDARAKPWNWKLTVENQHQLFYSILLAVVLFSAKWSSAVLHKKLSWLSLLTGWREISSLLLLLTEVPAWSHRSHETSTEVVSRGSDNWDDLGFCRARWNCYCIRNAVRWLQHPAVMREFHHSYWTTMSTLNRSDVCCAVGGKHKRTIDNTQLHTDQKLRVKLLNVL